MPALGTLGTVTLLFGFILFIAVLESILEHKGKKKWAKALHYAMLCLGLLLLSKVFMELIYVAEEMLAR